MSFEELQFESHIIMHHKLYFFVLFTELFILNVKLMCSYIITGGLAPTVTLMTVLTERSNM